MKPKTPVQLHRGKFKIDVLAARKAVLDGTLSARDREIISRVLPVVLEVVPPAQAEPAK